VDTDRLTADQAATHATRARRLLSAGTAAVSRATIRQWVRRGYLTPTGLADDGRTHLYRLRDVARAELATRRYALRRAGIPEQLPVSRGSQDQQSAPAAARRTA
jgi:DNA-binding transcriptional MerR regulator